MNEAKNLYVNSRLHPLLVGELASGVARDWIFSRGEPWLLLTPERLAAVALRLGRDDGRFHRLFARVRRHSRAPERFCRRLGVKEVRFVAPGEYPPALCPRCDGLHYPHPEDSGIVCPDCRERERIAARRRPGGGEFLDRRLDRVARRAILEKNPESFHNGVLQPNFRYNLRRRVHRDWDKAINCILMGYPYRQVAADFKCSVGLLHRKVREHHWERN